jgi:hypothetical protein
VFDIAIELENRNKELEDEQEARRKAEEAAENAPKNTADIFRRAIKGSLETRCPSMAQASFGPRSQACPEPLTARANDSTA